MDTNTATTAAAGTASPAPAETTTPGPVLPKDFFTNAKPSISFLTQDSDGRLIVNLGTVIEAMTDNPVFLNPVPKLVVVAAARDAYVSAVQGLDRSRPSTVRRDKARAAVVQLTRDLALYVQHTCQGDMEKLLSSGFPAQKGKRQPVGVLHAPQNVRLRPARVTGQILARCTKMPDAKAYQWRFATAQAPTVWTLTDTVIAASTTLVGLTRGTDYIVQVRAFGTRGASDWSDAATLMAG